MIGKSFYGLTALAILAALAVTGCGGGGGGVAAAPGNGTPPSITGEQSVVYKVLNSAPTDVCPNGGITVDAGIDTNGNGVLDDTEINLAKRQYVCNGATGATGATGPASPAGNGLTWVNVTVTSQQTVSNTGYLANNAGQVAFTLPASPAIGDVVRVVGVGAGGWKIAQNAGQTVITRDIDVWTPHGPNGNNWSSVASSADGTKLVATETNGKISTSTDSGQTWALQFTSGNAANGNLSAVASSSDGVKLVAVESSGLSQGLIFTSLDSGATWTSHTVQGNWSSVASSADGVKLVATTGIQLGDTGRIFTSLDSGQTWTSANDSPAANWKSVASSSDGTKLVAAVSGGKIFTSLNSGLNWTSTNDSPSINWQSVASSADGFKLVAVASGGQIYTSTNSGGTWTPHNVFGVWQSVASSSDGTRLVAVEQSPGGVGNIYLSVDAGTTWDSQGQFINWTGVASSADGNALVAVEGSGGFIYSFRGATTVGTAGSITGSQYDAIELQYIGNNTFTVLSHSGALVVR